MKKTIPILLIIFTLLITQALAVQICVKTNSTYENCFNENSNIFESGISFYEGQNDKLGLYIETPKASTLADKMVGYVPGSQRKINPSSLGDDTKFTFNNLEDFESIIQKKNADGNISLFSKKDLYEKERLQITQYTSEVLDWTSIVIIMLIEFTRIIINVLIILVAIFLVFRGIPMGLNFIKNMTIKFFIWSKSK